MYRGTDDTDVLISDFSRREFDRGEIESKVESMADAKSNGATGSKIDWSAIEKHERWALTVSDAVMCASEEWIDDAVHLHALCPICKDRFLDNAVLNFPSGSKRNLVHKPCFVGFLALHRSALQSVKGKQNSGDADSKKSTKKLNAKASWPEAGSDECELWLQSHLPPAMYFAPSPDTASGGVSLHISLLVAFVATILSILWNAMEPS